MNGNLARSIAFEVLQSVESQGAYASDELHAKLASPVLPADAALATEIAMGVLRWQRLLDTLLERQLRKPLARMDLPVVLALRIGAYQLRFLQKIPTHAAVNESVELVKRARKTSAASLVNAVLRRMAGETHLSAQELLPPDSSPIEALSTLHSHPVWMVERWMARFGETATIALLEANNRAPRLSCALHDANRRGETIQGLEASGLRVEPGVFLKTALRVSGGSPTRTDPFRKGWISVQDEASQTIPLLLGARCGDRVLDLCAAPGGKTPHLVRAVGQNGFVVAADRHLHRLQAMHAQMNRLGLQPVHFVLLDATRDLPFRFKFQRILVDAPCSGTGTLARHPEIRWRLQREQLAELHELQTELLASALAQLEPGGRLVYSTCSLEPEENEDVITDVLRRDPFAHRVDAGETARVIAPYFNDGANVASLLGRDACFRTFPSKSSTDGFYAAVLEKDGGSPNRVTLPPEGVSHS